VLKEHNLKPITVIAFTNMDQHEYHVVPVQMGNIELGQKKILKVERNN
jgi:hypothetical protein